MSRPPYYLEVLAAPHDPPHGAIVVRGLTARSLAELGREVLTAEENGDDVGDVLKRWALAYQ